MIKRIVSIGFLLLVTFLFSQNKKCETLKLENIEFNGQRLFNRNKDIQDVQKYFKGLKKIDSVSKSERKIPLLGDRFANEVFSNDEVYVLKTKDSTAIVYINLEKSNKNISIKKNKKRIIISKDFNLNQFKKIFPNSYKLAFGVPATPLSRAAFINVFVINGRYKGFIEFTFYDSKLVSICLLNKPSKFLDKE
jgi:hypothetical protein